MQDNRMPTADLLSYVRNFQTLATLGAFALLIFWETFFPFLAFSTRKAGSRLRHGGRNGLLAVINLTLQRFLFVGAWLWITTWTTEHQFGLLNLVALPTMLHGACAVLLFDFWTYWWHRINHEVFFFWRFHQVHHTDTEMDVTTAYRFHFGEMAFSSLFRIPLLALFGAQLWEIALYDLILFANVQFHHSNIGLPLNLDRPFRTIFTSPEMHKVHHSTDPKELNSNYTSFFSIWDRLFGTFRINPNPTNIEFGVSGYRDPADQTITSLLKCPFRINRDSSDQQR